VAYYKDGGVECTEAEWSELYNSASRIIGKQAYMLNSVLLLAWGEYEGFAADAVWVVKVDSDVEKNPAFAGRTYNFAWKVDAISKLLDLYAEVDSARGVQI